MNLGDLQEKALIIRELYRSRNTSRGVPSDTTHEIIMELASDIGDLSRYITQADREGDIDEKKEHIARELAECLSHILVLAQEYDIDLEESFLKEYNRLHTDLS